MKRTYGFARVSTKGQRITRQIANIRNYYSGAIIYTEHYTGSTTNRPSWNKLMKTINRGDTIIFDSVSRLSRNAEEGFAEYKKLYDMDVTLIFLKEPHINTDVFKQASENLINFDLKTGNLAIDNYFKGNIELINKLILSLAEEQIKLAFEQAEKELIDIRARVTEGLREAKLRNSRIGNSKGDKLTTKKSIECKEIIKKESKEFGGHMSDTYLIKVLGITRNTYYKYKSELKDEI